MPENKPEMPNRHPAIHAGAMAQIACRIARAKSVPNSIVCGAIGKRAAWPKNSVIHLPS